jgi:hypothetical protein
LTTYCIDDKYSNLGHWEDSLFDIVSRGRSSSS